MEHRPSSRRRSFRCLCLALAAAALAACASRPPLQLEAPPALFFEARPPGAPGLVYLLGSVHVGDRPLVLGPHLDAALRASDELVVEVDIGDLDPAWLEDLLQRQGMLPPGRTLRDVLSPETLAAAEAYARKRRLDLQKLQTLRPWALTLVIQELEFARRGVRSEHGVETFLLSRARGTLPIRSLETAEEQIEMMSGFAPELEEMMLADVLAGTDAADLGGDPDAMLDAWARGDAEGLAEQIFAPLREDPALAPFYEAVYFARNEGMARELAELARDGRTRFCVIGAGHVIGERSVPDLLRGLGFTVERVAPERDAPDPASPAAASP